MKGDFISTVSHELRTPLTAIMGAVDSLAGGVGGKLNETAHDCGHGGVERRAPAEAR